MIKTEGTVSNCNDAITKHQLDTAMIDKHDNNRYTNWKTLVCYEAVCDVLVSCKQSVFPIETHLEISEIWETIIFTMLRLQ